MRSAICWSCSARGAAPPRVQAKWTVTPSGYAASAATPSGLPHAAQSAKMSTLTDRLRSRKSDARTCKRGRGRRGRAAWRRL